MEAVLQFLKKMSISNIIAIVGTILLTLVLFIVILIKYNQPLYVTLYSNLELEDTEKITTELDQRNIPFQLRANGSQILVPEDQVLRIRMTLATEGIPGKGSIVGYEIFDNSDTINTSNFVQNIHLLRALEGELGRTISSFHTIKKARVHLVIPKRELFSREYQEPSASVVLDLKVSYGLSKEEVSAITHLVATAVAGLDPKKITIVDTRGKSLKIGEDSDGGLSGVSNSSQEYKINLEAKLKKTIETLLEKTVGPGGVDAQVSADVNFDRVVTNSEIYDPTSQVVRSTQTIEEKELLKEKNSNLDASVANNTPNAPGSSQTGENSNSTQKTDETVNYEISKTVKNHISETGTITKLSIAVLVDGVYTRDETTKELKYSPRTPAELAQLEKLVKSAVGYNEERKDVIEIANMQFKNIEEAHTPETITDWIKGQLENQLYGIIKLILLLTILVVLLLLFIKPFIYRVFDAAQDALKAQVDAEIAIAQSEVENANIKAQLERESRAVEMVENEEITKLKKSNAFKSINDIAEQCPKETLMIVRNWLTRT